LSPAQHAELLASVEPAAQGTALQADKLRVVLEGRAVLDGITCSLGRGWTVIVGPNGAGKSTLLRALAGLQPGVQGTVSLDGQPLHQMHEAQRGRRIAWLDQRGPGSGELDVGETVALGRLPHLGLLGRPGAADEAAVARAMALTGCAPWHDRRMSQLSGGERQRVLLARALATEAPVLLLDEPTTHLDPPHQVAMLRLARTLAATHAVVMVLHDLHLALHADRVLVLHQGRLRADDHPDAPALHTAIHTVFDGAVRVEDHAGRPFVVPVLDA
jgi:iron complex transport system ATP-binding protein